jgi:hypothetical protein
MSAMSVEVPFPVFYDRDGEPLENGYVWIGTANLNPQTNPIQVYFDRNLTQPAAQPLRTVAGYISNAGTPAQIYVDATNFSILVQDKNGTMVYNFPDGTGIGPNASGVDYDPGPDSLLFPGGQISVASALDQITDEATGSSIIGFEQAGVSAVPRSVQDKLREYAVSVKDFGAVGDGVADDRAAINAAFNEIINRGSGTIYFPAGTYFVSDFIGNTGSSSNVIDIAVIGEPGTIINCNPSVFGNFAVRLIFENLRSAYVSKIWVDCNNKVATGIRIDSTVSAVQIAEVDSCRVLNCFGVNNAGVTTSVLGISVSSAGWGFNATIKNCIVNNVRRDKTGLACQAVAATKFQNILIENNSITNVRHSGQTGDKFDADGIVVFSFQVAGLYNRSAATVINNTIRDCEGRFVKLQTNGSAVVQNNLMRNESAIELIENFVAVDSQVANATVTENKFYMGSTWTGGASASIFASQAPLAANTQFAFEAFYQKFNGNEVSCAKSMPYIVLPSFPANTTGTCYMEICDNTVTFDASLTTTNQSLVAASWFTFNGGAGFVAASSMTSQWVWTVARNRAQTFNFIGLPGVSSAVAGEDYTDKIFMYVYDNWKPSIGYDRNVVEGTNGVINGGVKTSTVMVRDNMVGSYAGQWAMNTDLAKMFNGCDFYSGASVNTNVPANYTFSRIARHGGMWIVHRAANGIYLSPDATTWTNIT